MSEPVDPSRWSCPLPLADYPTIVLGHGGGGKLSAELVEHLFVPDVHCLRDPTRGGAAASLTEIATSSGVGILLDERRIPVKPQVQAACDLLGLDPLQAANEGKLLAIVAPEDAEAALEALQSHPLGRDAAILGHVTSQHPGLLATKTAIGGTRVVPLPLGEQLPRIC